MDAGPFDPLVWIARGREIVRAARDGKVPDIELAVDVTGWPDTWVAAQLLTHDLGTDRAIDVEMVLYAENPIQTKPAGDVDALIERAAAARGAEQIAALEAAWRASFAPEIADAIEALDAATPIAPVKEPKKKSELEALWHAAAPATSPKSLFAGTWPSKWKDALRRMRSLCARPRSPLLAAGAIGFANRDGLPYTSLGSQTWWQALAWFIAEQCDVRQLPALEAMEKRIAEFVGRKDLYATSALRAFSPKPLSDKARKQIEALAVAKPAKAAALSLASAEERSVAADQLQQAGDPRGDFIAVQMRIEAEGGSRELLTTQAKLLKKHAKAWCPPMIYRDTCVFRGGVPVAGHLVFRSDSELRSFVGSKALATFEMLIVDERNSMGPIDTATTVAFVRSLPNLRTVVTDEMAAFDLARGAPTKLERVSIPSLVELDGPGLPELRRIDVDELEPAPWLGKLDELGVEDPKQWDQLWRASKLAPALVLCDRTVLHKNAPSDDPPWELVARRENKKVFIEARPLCGSTATSLAKTLARVPSWQGVEALRVPENFVDELGDDYAIEPTAAVEPARLGVALEWL